METIFVGMTKNKNYVFMEVSLWSDTYREFVCKIQKIENDKLIEILENLTNEEKFDILELFNLKPSEIEYGLIKKCNILKKYFDYNSDIGIVEAIGNYYYFTEIQEKAEIKNYLDINSYGRLIKEINNKTLSCFNLRNCTQIEEVLEDILCKTLFFENNFDINRELSSIVEKFGVNNKSYEKMEKLFEDLNLPENSYSIITDDNSISVAWVYKKEFYHKVFK